METVGDGANVARRDLEKVSGSAEAVWDEAFLVTFDQDDAQNPLNWTKKRKWGGVTAAISGTGFVRIMVSTMMAPAIDTMAEELDVSITESTMALSVYLLATAFGPLIIGPLSEIYGRKSIFHITNIWFLVWSLVCGFARSKGLLISTRLLAGFGASAVYSLGYGVLGDVWSAEQRGRSFSLYFLIPLTGSAVGPISYAPLPLRRRAEKLRSDTGDSRYYATIEMREVRLSPLRKLSRSLSRPLRLLAFHPIIPMQAILEGIDYGLLYFALSSFQLSMSQRTVDRSKYPDCTIIAICIVPELRITLLLPGALFTPIGFLLYSWAAQYHLIWVVVDIGGSLAIPRSASAATQVLRSLLAFALQFLLAFLSIGIALPATGILWRWGAKLRGRQQSSY
ncbi:major facilitator superfamily domain-containing protein [Aspergillus novoparasiticus]|uniref:Major facilitator superfamily domain-containing protein n=1 Tax=Aspergillus novoparasiticus TaxID=986946 RepID=A0A5N6F4V8_9EURO|nr:major facilitator superfamily domain-containing protein [Aspergillus novoparasiticus]